MTTDMHSPDHARPLTEAQEGLWFAQRLAPDNPVFNTGHCTEIRGKIDTDLLAQAIGQTLREADSLSLAFIDGDDGPRQYVDPARCPRLERLDMADDAGAREAIRQLITDDLKKPVDPVTMPLARHLLIRLGDDTHFWFQRVHHLAADGYGMALIEQRAVQIYHALQRGEVTGSPLTSFSAVIDEDQRYRGSEQRAKDAAFWRGQLQALDTIGSFREQGALSAHRVLLARRPAPESLHVALRRCEAHTQCSWPDIFTALAAAYIQRHVGQSPVVAGVPWMGRLGSAGARSVATVMNVVPLVIDIDQDAPLTDIIIEVSKALRQARRHGRYRSEQMRRDLGMAGGQGRVHGPLINILPFDAPYAQAGIDAQQEVFSTGPVDDFNFNVRAAPDSADMRIEIEANPKLYTQAEIEAHLARFIHFMEAALCAASLRPVQTLHGEEFRHWVHGVNDTAREIPDTTLVELVAQTCTRTPHAEALRMRDEIITYGRFGSSVNRAAQRLLQAGALHASTVAVALPRSPAMVMTLHAIQRAGAAWLPLDIEQPVDRIRRILMAAQPSVCIGDAQTLGMLREALQGLEQAPPALPAPLSSGKALTIAFQGVPECLDVKSLLDDTGAPETPDPALLPQVSPDDPAYVIYTSGSTGEPKGVVISHRAIVNRLLWMQEHYGLNASHRFLQKTPYTFDVSVWELFLPMLTGAPLVVAEPGEHRDPQALAALIRRENVDVVHFVPSMLAAFLDEPASEDLAMRCVFCSGEALPAHLRDRFHARMKAELHNLYGPTEAAVDVSWWPADADDSSDPVPIGFPVWNTQLLILDACLRPVPPGVTGTLYLGGIQLADGYLGRPDLTRERFIANPFSTDPDARLYDTGDLARWRPDGAVEYQGRLDHQVKIRGQRIELGEIESVLAGHPMCRQLAVIAQPDAQGGQRLVAYVVPQALLAESSSEEMPAGSAQTATIATDGTQGQTASEHAATLLAFAAQHLPPVMVPSAVVFLDTLPINVNGKLDRKKLPVPAFASVHSSRPLSTSTQEQVANAFRQVLSQEALPGADDDFFALGGHSLLATRLASRLRDESGTALTLGAVFEHPTVERLAAWIDHLKDDAALAERAGFGPIFVLRGEQVPPSAPAVHSPCPPASSAKRLSSQAQAPRHEAAAHIQPTGSAPLFCIHPAGGLAWCYGLLARRLSGNRPIIGLQSPALQGQHPRYGTLKQLAAHYVDEILTLLPPSAACALPSQAATCENAANTATPDTSASPAPTPADGQTINPMPGQAAERGTPVLHLIGWSTGGILAQEIACQLQQRGVQPGVVCLLDAYPAEAWRDRAPPEARDAWRAILHIAGFDPDAHPGLVFEHDAVIGFLRGKGHPLGELTDAQLNGIFDAVAFSNTLVRAHRHSRYQGELLYMHAALDHAGENLHPDMWRPWTDTMRVHDVPAMHAHLPGEAAQAHWLPHLENALTASERQPQG